MSGQDDPQTLVSVDWVRARLNDTDVKVLDASWHMPAANRDAVAEHAAGHIPGAGFFDIDVVSDASSPLPHMLPTANAFAAAVGTLGISNTDQVVIYDTVGLFSAARVWWMFRTMGHQNVAVLDGGLPAWKAAGGDIDQGISSVKKAAFDAQLAATAVTGLDDMKAASSEGSHIILDARPTGRFDGSQPEPRPGLPSGHMPNATSLPFSSVVTPQGTLKPIEDLKALFSNLAVEDSQKVITTCGSGVTAAILTLALARIGLDNTSLYDGSWTEWASRDDCPIETG